MADEFVKRWRPINPWTPPTQYQDVTIDWSHAVNQYLLNWFPAVNGWHYTDLAHNSAVETDTTTDDQEATEQVAVHNAEWSSNWGARRAGNVRPVNPLRVLTDHFAIMCTFAVDGAPNVARDIMLQAVGFDYLGIHCTSAGLVQGVSSTGFSNETRVTVLDLANYTDEPVTVLIRLDDAASGSARFDAFYTGADGAQNLSTSSKRPDNNGNPHIINFSLTTTATSSNCGVGNFRVFDGYPDDDTCQYIVNHPWAGLLVRNKSMVFPPAPAGGGGGGLTVGTLASLGVGL